VIFDLHTHSFHSDGSLSPQALVDLASEHGVTSLSITDHDSVDAYQGQLNLPEQMKLIPGVEFSTRWQKTGIHIVGLAIDPKHTAIQEGTRQHQLARQERALNISRQLEKRGIPKPMEGASRIAGGNCITRPHFARYLVDLGLCKNTQKAFDKYLSDKRLGKIDEQWASPTEVVDWINAANGIAILAHPAQYKLTRTRLLRLVDDFIAWGGRGIEVMNGNQQKNVTENLAQICMEKELLASLGSDFHSPEQGWIKPGMHLSLPHGCEPVWKHFCMAAVQEFNPC
jgi:predicted metal-dependent phosphoesterase TrpH